ncbi:MAG: hypothetical protein R3C70_07165 [Geminicoccaceae bacterium]
MNQISEHLPTVPLEMSNSSGGNVVVATMNTNMGAKRDIIPRDLGRVMIRIEQMAEYFGREGWEYRIPFKRRDRKTGEEWTEIIQGPTVGAILDICGAYGNCSLGITGDEDQGDAWVLTATFLDIETGFQLSRTFRQSKGRNIGGYGGDKGRKLDVEYQIGVSKALRNVGRNALRGLIDAALEKARAQLAAKIEKKPDEYRARIRQRLADFSIQARDVEAYFGSRIDEMSPPKLGQVIRMLQAIDDGIIKASEAFGVHEVSKNATEKNNESGPTQPSKSDEQEEEDREESADSEANTHPTSAPAESDPPPKDKKPANTSKHKAEPKPEPDPEPQTDDDGNDLFGE